MNATSLAAAMVVGYLLGALPFGYWVAQWHGVDIFKVGSGNPGATNVKRVIGKRAGNLVFGLDFAKGLVAAGWVLLLRDEAPVTHEWLQLIGLASAILGHSFSVFTRFRGGKGVATALGGAVASMPVAALVAAIVWVVLFYATRYVSVASIALALALPVAAFFLYGIGVLFGFSVVLALFVIYRHRQNIVRLIKGTENRFNSSREDAPEAKP
jgi:acyl phosphate:glycerol-3-phosphate acyltransferase